MPSGTVGVNRCWKTSPWVGNYFIIQKLPLPACAHSRIYIRTPFFVCFLLKMKPHGTKTGALATPKSQKNHRNKLRDGIWKRLRKLLKNGSPGTSEIMVFFRTVAKNAATGSAEKYEKLYRQVSKYRPDLWKWTPEFHKKRCLKTYPKKSKNIRNATRKSVPKNDFVFELAPRGPPLVAQSAFSP